MPVTCSGVDEAGYGPLLGPLSIVAVSAEVDGQVDLAKAFRKARTGVKDSKEIHTSGDIEAIERVALRSILWLTGTIPDTAAACFALLGELPEARLDKPWMQAAEDLRLPIAATKLTPWKIDGVQPAKLGGKLVQPCEFNRTMSVCANKADLELLFIKELLRSIPGTDCSTIVDRLGGRIYYGSFLQDTWPRAEVSVIAEVDIRSSYHVTCPDSRHQIAFCVDGESVSPLTAMASCIAKYARELHMSLLNAYWGERQPGLKPTAGYALDARRWIGELRPDMLAAFGSRLVRHGGQALSAV
jgi:ribonuclease HII